MANARGDTSAGEESATTAHATFAVTNASPLYTIDISRTLADAFLGRKRAVHLREWWRGYNKRFEWIYRFSLVATCACWFLADARLAAILQTTCLLASTPTIIFRSLFMSRGLLRMLSTHYEFCFTTAMNAVTTILLANVLGDARAVSSILVFFSYQTTVCIDATVFNVVPAARSSLLNLVCVATICAFAAVESIRLRKQGERAQTAVNLTAINLLVNVSMTLTVFVLSKSYKRRKCFSLKKLAADRVVPLGICFGQLAIRSFEACSSTSENRHAASSKVVPEPSREQTTIEFASRRLVQVSSATVLIERFHLRRRLSLVEWLVLQSCAALGLLCTLYCFTAIAIEHLYDETSFTSAMIVALLGTSAYCGLFFVQLETTLLREVFRKFDFWFLGLQSVAANICLADMLHWDRRCFSLIPWVMWFFWSLLQDAVLPTTRHSLRFRKAHAMPLIAVFVCGIGVAFSQLLFHGGGTLKGRSIPIVRVSPTLQMSIHTTSFLINRIWSMFVTMLRLVYALGCHRDEELLFIRASLQYESSWFDFCSRDDDCLPEARECTTPASARSKRELEASNVGGNVESG